MTAPATCRDVAERLEDLALAAVEEPDRSVLLSHVASCERCGAALADTARVADEVLLAAPEIEPPSAFERGVLDRIEGAPAGGGAVHRRPHRRRLGVATAAVAAAAVLLAAVALGWLPAPAAPDGSRDAAVVTSSGVRVGTVELADDPRPHVLVVLYGEGRYASEGVAEARCELETADGDRIVVGSWTVEQLAASGGVWAAGVDARLVDAATMRILGDRDEVFAVAELG